MLLHPEILSGIGAERDRSRLPVHAAPARRRRRERARAHRAVRTGATAADALRAALTAAPLGRGRTGTR